MSGAEEILWIYQYIRNFDQVNAKIIEGLGKYGPRNVLSLARRIGLPPSTVAYRIKKLQREGLLRMGTNLNFPKLGLVRAVLIAESKSGQEKMLQQTIDNLGYWTYMVQCYGKYDGYYTLFAFPAEYQKELEVYLEKAVQLEAFSRHIFYYTTVFAQVAPNFDWFDFRSKSWNFHWKRWIEEVQNSSDELPKELATPRTYHIPVDEADILILKEMEKDASAKFVKLSEVTAEDRHVTGRRWKRIVKQNLLASYEVATLPYPLPVSEMCSFIIDFENKEKLAKFVNTLQNKPFILTYGKTIGRHSLVVHTYTPKTQLPKFIDSMNRLTEQKLIKDFSFVILDGTSYRRQTVSYEFFRDNRWFYDQQKRIERLRRIVSESPFSR